jgi:hypothetical protein
MNAPDPSLRPSANWDFFTTRALPEQCFVQVLALGVYLFVALSR